ncbi:MAG: SpoIIE family protein phosphatase [Phycisphaerae bacterium]|nr:SpoIIE family protein phosphatase [Phycisphaerae bacterium]
MDTTRPPPDLFLQPLSRGDGGALIEPLALTGTRGFVVGRSTEADWSITEQTVSRRHATVRAVNGVWYLADAGSRHGTSVNGNPLPKGEQVPLIAGDHIRFGQWACRAQDTHRPTIIVTSPDGPAASGGIVSHLGAPRIRDLAQLRLTALLDASRRLSNAPTFAAIAEALVGGVVAGTGCQRAVVLRQVGIDDYEVLGPSSGDTGVGLSRSLLAAAALGTTVQLGSAADFQSAQSIIDLNIRTALCAPIMVGDIADALLYVDTREGEQPIEDDSAAFCQAIAQIGGLAVERLRRTETEAKRLRMELDLAAARRAQELLMPARHGSVPGVRYAFESLAGRGAAGDLFELVPLQGKRTAFFLGDVAGKGVGAAVLMAATQSSLRAMLLRGEELGTAVAAINNYLVERTESNVFVTLVAGIIDSAMARVEIVDAGHGLCCVVEPAQPPKVIDPERGGMALGISHGETYASEHFDLSPAGRVVMFSDGVIEQGNVLGVMFGLSAALSIIASSSTPADDVSALVAAVQKHADGPLGDDLTVASIARTSSA